MDGYTCAHAAPHRHCRGSNFNIFRHLGLSLREEVLIVDRAGGGFGALSTDETKWRCRVSGVVPGGMVSLLDLAALLATVRRFSRERYLTRRHG